MRLSGGGERHNLDEMTPRLIKSSINDDSANDMPVVTSWSGKPLTGFIMSRTVSAPQFIIAKNVIMMKPVVIKY